MSDKWKFAIRSFLTTFVATFLSAIPIASLVEGNFGWVEVSLAAAVVAGARTVIAALDTGQPLYGFGSGDDLS